MIRINTLNKKNLAILCKFKSVKKSNNKLLKSKILIEHIINSKIKQKKSTNVFGNFREIFLSIYNIQLTNYLCT